MLCEKGQLQTNLTTYSPEFMCQFIFVQFKTPSAQVIPTLKRANPPKLRGSRSIIQSIFTTCTTSVTPKTNKHTHTEKLRCLQGNIWSKEEQGGGGEGRSCHLYQVLLESSRFILKPFDLRGLRSDIFKVYLNGRHCTAHIAHSVTKCGDQKCIEEQSSSISSNAQCQSWRLESSNLKGEISFHGRVIVTAHNSSLFCGVVWGQILRHRTGLDQDRQWQQFLNFCRTRIVHKEQSLTG